MKQFGSFKRETNDPPEKKKKKKRKKSKAERKREGEVGDYGDAFYVDTKGERDNLSHGTSKRAKKRAGDDTKTDDVVAAGAFFGELEGIIKRTLAHGF